MDTSPSETIRYNTRAAAGTAPSIHLSPEPNSETEDAPKTPFPNYHFPLPQLVGWQLALQPQSMITNAQPPPVDSMTTTHGPWPRIGTSPAPWGPRSSAWPELWTTATAAGAACCLCLSCFSWEGHFPAGLVGHWDGAQNVLTGIGPRTLKFIDNSSSVSCRTVTHRLFTGPVSKRGPK